METKAEEDGFGARGVWRTLGKSPPTRLQRSDGRGHGGHDRDRPPARAHPHMAVSWPRHGKEDHLNLTN